MISRLTLAGLAVLIACTPAENDNAVSSAEYLPRDSRVFRIAFGSCNKHDLPQPLWEPIIRMKPDLWIWLGDIIYADTEDMDVMKQKYNALKTSRNYQRLLQTCPVIGVWDDHDFGENNSGQSYPMKKESQRLLLDFLDEPSDSPRRRQEGVYTGYEYVFHGHRIKIILPDERYFRDRPGAESDILGEAQWRWLESEIQNDSAEITFFGSSTQVLPDDQWSEMWNDYPKSRQRLLQLLKQYQKPGWIILSGDRHWGEISVMNDGPCGYPLYEITSSGMTHHKSWLAATFMRNHNRYRCGEVYRDLNYGMIDIYFNKTPVEIHAQIRDTGNRIQREVRIALTDLKAK